MRKIVISFLFFVMPHVCFAYTQLQGQDNGTHYNITAQAIKQSNIATYLNDNLAIKLTDIFKGVSEKPKTELAVEKWIAYGSDWEDIPVTRALNHFYDPLSGRGLPGDDSALNWAWQGMPSFWAWNDARHYFYRALSSKTVLGDTSTDPAVREYNLAKTFRALGQIVHLLQNMAVPAHTRLDIHPDEETFGSVVGQYQQDMYELYTATATLSYGGYVMQPIPFNKFDDYWHTDSGGKGLADFTNRNFLSRNTNLDDNEYVSPVAIKCTLKCNKVV
jgi:hypothetical protein